ncbi:MAG: uridine kinase [Proteobacteria bacterium]|nr:uridine kinase [Pseudomonadota bacterium]
MFVYVVAIAGGTGSGKSTLARQLLSISGEQRAALLELDCYYRSQDHRIAAERATVNYDHPDAIEFELLTEHLQTLKAGAPVVCPVYNFAEHARIEAQTTHLAPKPVIIVEGILSLAIASVRDMVDFGIFIDTPDELRLSRRIHRDIRERGRTEQGTHSYWNRIAQPMHQEFCAPSRHYAHLIIDGGSSAPLDATTIWATIWERRNAAHRSPSG